MTLALGIGATTTIFGVVNGVLLRPLPFPDQERLFMLWQRAPGVGVAEDWFSPAQYFDIRERVPSFEETAIVFGRNVTLTGDGIEPQRLGALEVSSSFFDMLAIDSVLGRVLISEDDLPGSSPKVVLTSSLFERRFGNDSEIIGRTIVLDGERLEVAGVLPPLPLDADILPTLATIPRFELVLSLPMEDPERTTHGSENYNILAKTAVGMSFPQVEKELLSAAEHFVQDPGSLGAGLKAGSEFRIDAVPLLDQMTGDVELPLLVLLGATIVLLVIACANVWNLLLTRAATRCRELSIRAALGAGRARIVLSSLVESLLLALAGAGLGVGMAYAGLRALHIASPKDLPRLGEVGIDVQVLVFAIVAACLSSTLFGLGPALRISSVAPKDALSEIATAVRARSLWRGGSRYLVVIQVALSLVLVTGAGLLMRSLERVRAVDPGFRPEGVLSFRLSLTGERFADPDERHRFFDRIFDEIRGLPGVSEAGGISMLPLTRGYAWTDFIVEGFDTPDERDRIVADVHVVTPGYFEAMGIPVLAGRTFTAADQNVNGPPVVLINRDFAERFWPIEEAVGRWVGRNPEDRTTILGVVENVKHYGLDAPARLTVFYPHRMSARRTLFGVVRSEVEPMALGPQVRAVVNALDPTLAVYAVRSMSDRVLDSLARHRVLMALLNLFALVALTLATIGLYGVLSFTVATHAREMGIRKALGAQSRDLYRHVLEGAALVVGVGILVGLGATLAGSRYLDALIYGVSTRDPLTLVASGVGVLVVGLIVSLLPARRAASVEPVVALKEE